MNIVIRKIGNSEGVIIPKEVLDSCGLKTAMHWKFGEVDGNSNWLPERADLAEQLQAARLGMEKYRVALRELAE